MSYEDDDDRRRTVVTFRLSVSDLERLQRIAKADGYESYRLWARDMMLSVLKVREATDARRREAAERRSRGEGTGPVS